jgi:hypothetical protein
MAPSVCRMGVRYEVHDKLKCFRRLFHTFPVTQRLAVRSKSLRNSVRHNITYSALQPEDVKENTMSLPELINNWHRMDSSQQFRHAHLLRIICDLKLFWQFYLVLSSTFRWQGKPTLIRRLPVSAVRKKGTLVHRVLSHNLRHDTDQLQSLNVSSNMFLPWKKLICELPTQTISDNFFPSRYQIAHS